MSRDALNGNDDTNAVNNWTTNDDDDDDDVIIRTFLRRRGLPADTVVDAASRAQLLQLIEKESLQARQRFLRGQSSSSSSQRRQQSPNTRGIAAERMTPVSGGPREPDTTTGAHEQSSPPNSTTARATRNSQGIEEEADNEVEITFGRTPSSEEVTPSEEDNDDDDVLFAPSGVDVVLNDDDDDDDDDLDPDAPVDERILYLLQKQSAMMKRLNRKVDRLSAQVQRQRQQQRAGPLTREAIIQRIEELTVQVEEYHYRINVGGAHGRTGGSGIHHGAVVDGRVDRAPPPQQQQPADMAPGPGYRERLAQISNLFFALYRRHAPNFNMGLILKVSFMLAVLVSRFNARSSSTSKGQQHWSADYRSHALVFFVAMGLMIQTGFLQFLWLFFFKENYIGRIWNGEEIDVEAELIPAPPPPPPRPRGEPNPPPPDAAPGPPNQEPPEENRGWRETFLGGGIARPQPGQPFYGPLKFLLDVGMFIGSFFLSIFPMWQPAPIGGMPGAGGDDADDGVGLPEVRPPRNPVEPADDE